MAFFKNKNGRRAGLLIGGLAALTILAVFLFARFRGAEGGLGGSPAEEAAAEGPFGTSSGTSGGDANSAEPSGQALAGDAAQGQEALGGEEEESGRAGSGDGGGEVTDGTGVMDWEPEAASDDVRIHGFPFIELTSQLHVGDYVDVRIAFADGADFVLLSKKKIQGLGPLWDEGTDALWLAVSEEELLRLSSARVDLSQNDGCSVYAISYVSEDQKGAVVNYGVRDMVRQLMDEDPNIQKRDKNASEWPLWGQYRKGLKEKAKGSLGGAADEEVYPEQEEIIYMD